MPILKSPIYIMRTNKLMMTIFIYEVSKNQVEEIHK